MSEKKGRNEKIQPTAIAGNDNYTRDTQWFLSPKNCHIFLFFRLGRQSDPILLRLVFSCFHGQRWWCFVLFLLLLLLTLLVFIICSVSLQARDLQIVHVWRKLGLLRNYFLFGFFLLIALGGRFSFFLLFLGWVIGVFNKACIPGFFFVFCFFRLVHLKFDGLGYSGDGDHYGSVPFLLRTMA